MKRNTDWALVIAFSCLAFILGLLLGRGLDDRPLNIQLTGKSSLVRDNVANNWIKHNRWGAHP